MILATAMISLAAALCVADDLSAEAQALHRQLSLRMPPAMQMWVLTEAQRVRADLQWEERHVRMSAQSQFTSRPVIGDDLDALVFLVYTEVLQRFERQLHPRQVRQPSGKQSPSATTNTVPAVTNKFAEAIARQERELAERRARLAVRANELAQRLWTLSGTLLQEIR